MNTTVQEKMMATGAAGSGNEAPMSLEKRDSEERVLFTKEMKDSYTLLIPMMAPIHFALVRNVFANEGYNVVLLTNNGPGVVEEGLKYVRFKENEYALIIVDSTDPFGPGEGLFTREFYGNCYKALKEDGIMVNQHESPFYAEDAEACKRAHKRIVESFPISRVYQAHIPTYPSGHWLFGFASKKYHPLKDLDETRWNLRGLDCRYYTTTLHKGAFYLPAYVEEMLEDVEGKY